MMWVQTVHDLDYTLLMYMPALHHNDAQGQNINAICLQM